ncbi:hypothetical protein [Paraburkholderia megapolitana]|uniref:hypothetical protein n=1 Tax=Paraburkholderia megapolitana TaxID=420953 RepID=UPI0038BD944A
MRIDPSSPNDARSQSPVTTHAGEPTREPASETPQAGGAGINGLRDLRSSGSSNKSGGNVGSRVKDFFNPRRAVVRDMRMSTLMNCAETYDGGIGNAAKKEIAKRAARADGAQRESAGAETAGKATPGASLQEPATSKMSALSAKLNPFASKGSSSSEPISKMSDADYNALLDLGRAYKENPTGMKPQSRITFLLVGCRYASKEARIDEALTEIESVLPDLVRNPPTRPELDTLRARAASIKPNLKSEGAKNKLKEMLRQIDGCMSSAAPARTGSAWD